MTRVTKAGVDTILRYLLDEVVHVTGSETQGTRSSRTVVHCNCVLTYAEALRGEITPPESTHPNLFEILLCSVVSCGFGDLCVRVCMPLSGPLGLP